MRTETEIIDGIKVTKVIYEENDMRNDSEKESILTICESCDKYNDGSCAECGCLIQVLIGLKENHCPIERW